MFAGYSLCTIKFECKEERFFLKNFRLHRSESANTNKGFLMNSYKNQITEITKERDQFSKKAKELENENNSLRTKNSKLKGKVCNYKLISI